MTQLPLENNFWGNIRTWHGSHTTCIPHRFAREKLQCRLVYSCSDNCTACTQLSLKRGESQPFKDNAYNWNNVIFFIFDHTWDIISIVDNNKTRFDWKGRARPSMVMGCLIHWSRALHLRFHRCELRGQARIISFIYSSGPWHASKAFTQNCQSWALMQIHSSIVVGTYI